MSSLENRILELLKTNNLNYKDLILYLIKETNGKKDDYNIIKTNFSKMISGERKFKYEYIPLIERKLKTTIDYIINGESSIPNGFIPKGIRYTAFEDNYENYEKILSELNNEDILFIFDEYKKSIVDYIINFKSINGIKFLLNKYDCLDGIKEEFIYKIIDIVFAKEASYLNKILFIYLSVVNVFDNILNKHKVSVDVKYKLDFNSLFKNDEEKCYAIIDRIIKDDEVFNSFIQEIENKNVLLLGKEYKIYSFNIMLLLIINRMLKEYEYYKNSKIDINDKINRIIEYAKYYNDILRHEFCDELNIKRMKIFDENICSNDLYFCFDEKNNRAASVFIFDIDKKYSVPDEIKKSIYDIQKKDLRIENINKERIMLKDGKIYKKRSMNNDEYDFLKLMEKNNYNKVPKYYGYDNEYDIFEFIDGYTEKFVSIMPIEKIYELITTIKEINEISKKHLNGKVYVHNDLSPMNVVFNYKEKLMGIIDWEHCKIGEEYENLIHIIWLWSNIGSLNRDHNVLLQYLDDIIKFYNPSDDIKYNFVDKMKKVMDNKQQSAKEKFGRDSKEYLEIYEWVEWSKIWVRFNREMIQKIVDN